MSRLSRGIFRNSSTKKGKNIKNKTLLTLCAAPLLLSVNSMAAVSSLEDGAFSLAANGKTGKHGEACYTLTINDNYDGANAFVNWVGSADYGIVKDCITDVTYNRQFKKDIPATVVFPTTVQTEAATNASFYALQYVIPDLRDGKRTWLAKMKKIVGRDVSFHEPVAVIVNEDGPITFNSFSVDPHTIVFPKYIEAELRKKYNEDYNGDDQLQELGVTLSVYNNAEDWYFVGTYENGTWSNGDGEVGLCYGFEGSYDGAVSRGEFGKIAAGTTKRPFRSYLCKKDANVQLPLAKQSANGANMFSLPESINVEFVDTDANGKEHTTYVGKLNRMDKILQNRERSTFDLKGRNVDGKKTAKGVYLKK